MAPEAAGAKNASVKVNGLCNLTNSACVITKGSKSAILL